AVDFAAQQPRPISAATPQHAIPQLDHRPPPQREHLVGAQDAVLVHVDAQAVAEARDVLRVVAAAAVDELEVETGVAEMAAGGVEEEVALGSHRDAEDLGGVAARQREDDLEAALAA